MMPPPQSKDVVEAVAGADLTRLPLNAQEGFVLSRVEGRMTVHDLVASTGLPAELVEAALARLMELGALRRMDPNGGPPVDGPVALTDAQRRESVDLTEEQRQRIVEVERLAERLRHYELLGVRRGASSSEIKRAYFERSKEFHPDAFFRKELGSFKPRLERIFRQLKLSYDLLCDAERRGDYDHSLAREHAAQQPRPAPAPEWMNDPRRQKEAEERRLRRNPMVERVARAKRHLTRAEELIASKQYAQAANELALAAAQDPQNATIRQLQEQVQGFQRGERLERLVARVSLLCSGTEVDEAGLAHATREAVELEGSSVTAYLKMARMVLSKGHYRLARGPAERALKLAPDDVKVLALMADLYDAAGLTALLTKTLERLAQLQPGAGHDDRLKRLKQARK